MQTEIEEAEGDDSEYVVRDFDDNSTYQLTPAIYQGGVSSHVSAFSSAELGYLVGIS